MHGNKIIDCDTLPFVPPGWMIKEHRKGGKLEWVFEKISLYFSEEQEKGEGINGFELQKKLETKQVLNANVLDSLLINKDRIPVEWEDKWVFFWGTIYFCYCDQQEILAVRCLRCSDGQWEGDYGVINFNFKCNFPAAILIN